MITHFPPLCRLLSCKIFTFSSRSRHLLHSLCVYWVHQMVVNMQRSVLIVDDDARLRRVLVDFLQKEN